MLTLNMRANIVPIAEAYKARIRQHITPLKARIAAIPPDSRVVGELRGGRLVILRRIWGCGNFIYGRLTRINKPPHAKCAR